MKRNLQRSAGAAYRFLAMVLLTEAWIRQSRGTKARRSSRDIRGSSEDE